MKKDIVIYTSGRRYGAAEMMFRSEEMAIAYAIMTLKTEKWALLPIYLGKRVARV